MSSEPLQRSTQSKSYVPTAPNPDAPSSGSPGPSASAAAAQKPKPLTVGINEVEAKDIELVLDFDANRKTKNHINIRIKDKKGVAQRFAVALPAGFCRTRINEAVSGQHAKNRQMIVSWVARDKIAIMQKYYEMLFSKLVDFVLQNRSNGIADDTFVYDHGKGMDRAATYYNLVDEVDTLDAEITTALRKKQNPQDIEEMEDQLVEKKALLEAHTTSFRIKLWSMCDIKGVLSRPGGKVVDLKLVDDEVPVRTKYIETTTYPDKKNDKITEEEYQRRLKEGNINRLIFVGDSLRNDKVRFGMIRDHFSGPAKDSRIPITVMKSKKGNEFVALRDLDMVAKLNYKGVPHMCKCGIDVVEERFYLSQDGKHIRLKEEFSSATLYDIVKQPEALQYTRVDDRELESMREEEASNTSGEMHDIASDMGLPTGSASGSELGDSVPPSESDFKNDDFVDG